MTNSGSDSVAGTGVGGTGFGCGRAGSLKPRSGLMRTMLALVIGVPRSYRPFRGQWRAMRPTTIQPITRAAMLRPKTQLRTADSGKGSITVSSAEDPRSVAFYMVRRDRSVPLDRMCSPLSLA